MRDVAACAAEGWPCNTNSTHSFANVKAPMPCMSERKRVQLCVRASGAMPGHSLANVKARMLYISKGNACPNLCPRVWCYAWYDSSDAGFLCLTLCPSSLYWDCHIKLQMDTKSASGHYNTINRGGKCPGPPVVRSSIVVLDLSRGGVFII